MKPEQPFHGPITREEQRSLLAFEETVDANFEVFWRNTELESQTHDTAGFILKSLENCVKAVRPHTFEGVLARLPEHTVFGAAAMLRESRLAEERPVYPGQSNTRIRGEVQRVLDIAETQVLNTEAR